MSGVSIRRQRRIVAAEIKKHDQKTKQIIEQKVIQTVSSCIDFEKKKHLQDFRNFVNKQSLFERIKMCFLLLRRNF